MTEANAVVSDAIVRHQEPPMTPLVQECSPEHLGRLHHQEQILLRALLDAVVEGPAAVDSRRKIATGSASTLVSGTCIMVSPGPLGHRRIRH